MANEITKVTDQNGVDHPFKDVAAFPRSEQATTGAYNLFDINLPRINGASVTSPVTSSATGSSLTVSNSTAGTYKEADYFGLSFPKNANLKAIFGATVTSGKGKFYIDGSNDGTNWTSIASSDVITTNGDFTVPFNTGNYASYRIRWYCTFEASTTGSVTYTDIMIVYALNTPSAYVPFAKTNQQLTTDMFPRSEQAVLGAANLNPYPYRSTTGSSHGIDYTVNSNGSVTVDGLANGYSDFPLHDRNADPVKLPAGTYWVYGGYSNNVRVVIGRTYNGAWQILAQSKGTPVSFTVEEGDNLGVTIDVLDTTNVDNVTVYPMIATSPNYTDFVPFAMTNKELTEKAQGIINAAVNAADFAAFKTAIGNL